MASQWDDPDPGSTSGQSGAMETAREEAAMVAETAKEQASQVTDSAKEQATKVAETAKEQASQVAGEVGRQARSLLDETRSQLRTQAQEQTERVGATLTDLAQQLRGMAENAPDPSSSLAGLASDGAARLDRFASQLQSGGFEGILEDLKTMARRRPGVYLAGAAVAGVVVGRLFRNVDLSQQTSGGASERPEGGDGW
jgi:vacuolar-type H+-ATPase subunit H